MGNRALLICPEPLGHHQPAGVGIRFLELASALVTAGHQVTVLSPAAGNVEGARSGPLTPAAIRAETGLADVALVQGHAANDFFAHGLRVPTVIDLYDPFIIENLHYRHPRHETFLHDHETLLRTLRRGDFFLCASEAQRHFYLGMLLSLGRLNPLVFSSDPTGRNLLDLVPFGVPPPREAPSKSPDNHHLLFGGIYDWYDPAIAIEAVARARETFAGLTLTFTHHPNLDTTPQDVFHRTREMVSQRGWESFIRFEPWIPYHQRSRYYDQYRAALLTFRPSIETDLAMRTRIFDFLWGGLPVITRSAGGTDAILSRFHAGLVVDGDDPAAYASVIERILRDQEEAASLAAGTRRFVAEHQWSVVARPLLRFVEAPVFDDTKLHFPERESDLAPPRRSFLRRIHRKLGGAR
ncbi:MAG TPA: glycosyltransferase family 4 protein [Thermoanaerobaculia bacterium]|nr:glycosyltransferase family 4 protein [Thermoanaerobaculia bacterium]